MTEELLVERRGPVRLVTFNRPDTKNAVTATLQRALINAVRQIGEEPDARAIVITGAGQAFTAGGDLDSIALLIDDPHERRASLAHAQRVVEELLACPLPIIAAVNGPAVGLGCTLALLSDIVLMADTAFLADPHVTIGLVAGDGGAVAFPLLTSMLRAKEYLLTGRRIPAGEAERVGLANRVVAADSLLDEANQLADAIAALPPQAVQDTKRVLNRHLQRSALDVLSYGLAAEAESYTRDDASAIVDALRSAKRQR